MIFNTLFYDIVGHSIGEAAIGDVIKNYQTAPFGPDCAQSNSFGTVSAPKQNPRQDLRFSLKR
jgi:hypothetical protein